MSLVPAGGCWRGERSPAERFPADSQPTATCWPVASTIEVHKSGAKDSHSRLATIPHWMMASHTASYDSSVQAFFQQICRRLVGFYVIFRNTRSSSVAVDDSATFTRDVA